jgi:outer membrane protein assembly factor BamB
MRVSSVCLAFLPLLCASDWPRYRGPNGTGISSDRPLPAEIGPEKNLLWKAQSLKGNSSPVVVKDHLCVTGHEGDDRVLLCYNAQTGALLWRKAITKARTEVPNPMNGPTTPTPATDGKSLFVFYPEFGLLAYDLDGNEQWRVPLGPFGGIQGVAVSPVYAEGNVILLIDTPEVAYVAAFDAQTGRQSWRVERPIGFLGSYATPSVYRPPAGPVQIIVAGAVELTGYQAKTGEKLWWSRSTYAPAALPLVSGDSVYTVEPAGEAAPPFSQMLGQLDRNKNGTIEIAELEGDKVNDKIMYRLFKSIDKIAGNNDGIVTEQEFNQSFRQDQSSGGLIRMRVNGKGDVSKTNRVWRYTKGMPYVTAPLLYLDVLYIIRDGGILASFHPETGQLLREERLKEAIGDYYASPVAGDGKIYFVNKEGKISVITAGRDWKLLYSADLQEQVIATPAIAGGRIYIRSESGLYAFGLSQPAKAD